MKKIFKIGLVPRLIIAIISGITFGVAAVPVRELQDEL